MEAFRAGARGLFSRHESLETLGKCVRTVFEGEVWATSQQIAFAIEALASSPTMRTVGPNGLSLLSKRELDVVHCLAEGLTNREIAERLSLSQHTIKNYLFRVFDKLGVSSRLELLSPCPNRRAVLPELRRFRTIQAPPTMGKRTLRAATSLLFRKGPNKARPPLSSHWRKCTVREQACPGTSYRRTCGT